MADTFWKFWKVGDTLVDLIAKIFLKEFFKRNFRKTNEFWIHHQKFFLVKEISKKNTIAKQILREIIAKIISKGIIDGFGKRIARVNSW